MKTFKEFIALKESILLQRSIRKGYKPDHAGLDANIDQDMDDAKYNKDANDRDERIEKAERAGNLANTRCPFCKKPKTSGAACPNHPCKLNY